MSQDDGLKTVEFCCQKCLQPIVFEDFNLTESDIAEFLQPLDPSEETDETEPDPSGSDVYGPKFTLDKMAAHDFVKVQQGVRTSVSPAEAESMLSQNFRLRAQIFDALSDKMEFSHPLCEDCCDSMIELMDQQIANAERDWKMYNDYLKGLEEEEGNEQKEETDVEKLQEELATLSMEEKKLIDELTTLSNEAGSLKQVLKGQEDERKQLQNEEEKYWREYSKHRRELMISEDEYRSVETRIFYAQQHLDKLKKTNVFQMAFVISHSGQIGTINGFRLGRLPATPVEWSEINAAWGQTALCLVSLARKVGLTFSKYRIVPYGNHSYIEVLADNRELPLYGSGGFRFFWDTKFDNAMAAFLDCLQQFQEQVETGTSGFHLPYKIDKGKIEEAGNSYSIKIQFNSEEQWTKALKLTLTNLRWGLAWISSLINEEEQKEVGAVGGASSSAASMAAAAPTATTAGASEQPSSSRQNQ